jgi:hypothetical protein
MNDLPASQNGENASNPTADSESPGERLVGTANDKKSNTPTRKSNRYCNLRKAPTWIEAACAVALVVITGFYTHYAHQTLTEIGKQSPEIKKSAEAAKSAADTAHDSLVLANRPWIKIKHRIVKPLNFDFVGAAGPAATMDVEDTMENVGNSVALNVISWEDVIPVDPDFSTTSARKRRDEWCNANKRFDPANSTTLNGRIMFPHDPFVQVSGMGPLMSTVNKAVEDNMIPLKNFFRGSAPNPLLGKVQFVMVGCVVYGSSFEPDGTRQHTTGFLYRLAEPLPGGAVQGFISPHGTADRLQLIAFPDGFFAY